jgi:DNA-binding NtrC family response regulator
VIPPLRHRRDDIPLLVEHFLEKVSIKNGEKKNITKDAMNLLTEYEFPGNVRELENIMERAIILQEGEQVDVEDLPDKVRSRTCSRSSLSLDKAQMTLEELEKEYLISVLEETNWQKKKASSILGINASTLYRKIQRYGLEREMMMRAESALHR